MLENTIEDKRYQGQPKTVLDWMSTSSGREEYIQELIGRLDSRTLRAVNSLGLLNFSNNIKNSY